MPVEFQEDQNVTALYQRVQQSQEVTGYSKLVIKLGLASDEEGANKILVAVMVIVLLITAFVVFKYIL